MPKHRDRSKPCEGPDVDPKQANKKKILRIEHMTQHLYFWKFSPRAKGSKFLSKKGICTPMFITVLIWKPSSVKNK